MQDGEMLATSDTRTTGEAVGPDGRRWAWESLATEEYDVVARVKEANAANNSL